jgi:large subunit ribosomal protein L17
MSNMASSLILKKRIFTTVAKAKALRQYVEPLITKSKEDTTQNRRVVFSYLQDKASVQALFGEVAEKVAERPGGYTRIIRTGNRLGDSAEMCLIELVDFNELLLGDQEGKKAKTRRSRRSKKEVEAAASPKETKAAAASREKKEAAPAAPATQESPESAASTDAAEESTDTEAKS